MYIIVKADLSHCNKIKGCMNKCSSEYYYTEGTTLEWIEKNISENGVCFIALNELEEVIGFCVLIYKDLVNTTAKDLGFSDINQLETMAVLPSYRGKGIASKLVSECLKHKTSKHILATVHPENLASISVLEKNSFRYKTSKKLYGGLDRSILIQCK